MDQQRSGPSGAAGGLSRAAGQVATACLGLMVALGLLNTGLRWLGKQLGENLAGNAGLEGQWYLFSLAFLLAAAPTLARGEHVRVDVLSGRLSPKARAWVYLVGGLALLLPFCAFAAWSTGEIPAENAIRGFHGVSLLLENGERTGAIRVAAALRGPGPRPPPDGSCGAHACERLEPGGRRPRARCTGRERGHRGGGTT